MDWYRVTVEFNNIDAEGQAFVDKETYFQVARNEHMACLIIGAEWFAAGDYEVLVSVHAVMDTN